MAPHGELQLDSRLAWQKLLRLASEKLNQETGGGGEFACLFHSLRAKVNDLEAELGMSHRNEVPTLEFAQNQCPLAVSL